jgi:hypothetical protein
VTLDDYFGDCLRLVDHYGLAFEPGCEMVKLRTDPDRRGRIRGKVGFTNRTFLAVSEQVEMQDGEPIRLSYSYYLIIDGIEVWGHDDDPGHDPAIHRHSRKHAQRYPDQKRTLGEMLEKGWTTAGDEDFWAYSDEATQEDA